eukprot:sb/3478848/
MTTPVGQPHDIETIQHGGVLVTPLPELPVPGGGGDHYTERSWSSRYSRTPIYRAPIYRKPRFTGRVNFPRYWKLTIFSPIYRAPRFTGQNPFPRASR